KTFRDLYKMIVHTRAGAPFQLEQVANFRFDLGPSEIWRKDRSRMIGVSANLNDIELSEAVELVKKNLADLEFPEDYYYRIGGDYDKLIKSQKEMKMVILMVVLLVYMVLASLFESLLQPFLIMISVPLALGGAVATLYFGPRSIGIGALLGLMMLAGIVVNHSIMLMERINYYRKEVKLNPLKSVILSNKDRLRPILMTTSTTVLGLIPMAIDKGEGANLWSPLALTVIGGLMSSLVLTLAVTPSFYIASVTIGEKIKKIRNLSGTKQ
ncbi:MAG: efflux RND transporter permease subunit, partial [Candidatus Omnitrophica bacterium]|nr:efflux RND transporter permease subunit [Candidatus Omnitrophota bacterium]